MLFQQLFVFSAIFAQISLVGAKVQIPEAFRGSWSGSLSMSPLGPKSVDLPDGGDDYLQVSWESEDGATYFYQRAFDQVWHINSSGAIQYCSLGADAPFEVVSTAERSLTICWRGPRLPSHKAGCSGCDCAQWNLVVSGFDKGDTLTATFMMSPPAVHAQYTLTRTGGPPNPSDLAAHSSDGAGCVIKETPSGNQRRRLPSSHQEGLFGAGCPMLAALRRRRLSSGRKMMNPVLQRLSAAERILEGEAAAVGAEGAEGEDPAQQGPYSFCKKLNHDLDVRIAYTVPELPCTPCAVNFTYSVPAGEEGQYIAVGFKELSAPYETFDTMPYNIPDYWGMSTSGNFTTPLSGRILAGYLSAGDQENGEGGAGCVRHMEANAYVGSVVDVPDDGFFSDVRLSQIDGRTRLEFTATTDVGTTMDELDWQTWPGIGSQRVMWALGSIGNGDGCTARLGYHSGDRGVSPFGFPESGTVCNAW